MKTLTLLAAAACLVSSASANAASPAEAEAGALRVYPKNLARQHLGTNVFLYNEGNQTFVPTEAGAAWLDDDVATGWPAATGRQYYMLAFSQAELVTTFALSTRGSTGTVTIYAGDEAAPPSAKSWVPLARDLSVEALNEKGSGQTLSRFAKYILIETNLTASGPWYGIYLYGEKPATSYSLEKRSQPLNAQSIFRFVNDQTSISLSSLYAKARVAYVNSEQSAVALQKAIDDNPETSVSLVSSERESGMIVRFNGSRSIQRVSALTDVGAKGRLDFYLVNEVAPLGSTTASNESQYLRASYNGPAADAPEATHPASVANLKPVGSITLDGVNPRGSTDFASERAETMLVTWTPETAGQTVAIREVNTFGDVGVTNHQLATKAEVVGELGGYDASKDGKEMIDGKELLDGKEALPAVGEQGLAPKTPFVSGPPPVPPIIPLPRIMPMTP